MGFFSKLFGKYPDSVKQTADQDEQPVMPIYSVEDNPCPPGGVVKAADGIERKGTTITINKDRPRDMLLYATAMHDDKCYYEAVQIMQIAIPILLDSDEPLMIQERLRLSRYFRDWGKYEEAWADLNDLLVNWKTHRDILPMDRSEIYRSMRIQLVKEERHTEAVRYAIMSRFSWGIGLCKQERWTELNEYPLNRNIRVKFRKLLKKAGQEGLLQPVMEAYCEHLKLLPETNVKKLMNDIDEILNDHAN